MDMRKRALSAMAVLILAMLGTFAITIAQEPRAKDAKADALPGRVLPGLRRDGFVQLPNQWALKPTGRSVELGDFPVNIALHPTGQFAAVLHAGFGPHEVVIVDLNQERTRVLTRATLTQSFYGLTFSPDGKQLYASGCESQTVHVFDFNRGYLSPPRTIDVSHDRAKSPIVVGGLAMDAAGKDLFVASPWADCVVRVPLENPDNRVLIPMTAMEAKKEPAKGEPPSPPDGRKDPNEKKGEKAAVKATDAGSYPYVCLVEPSGKRAFVSLWSRSAVAVIDLEANKVIANWSTSEHPTEMVLSPNGRALYVACANSTKVSVLDPETGRSLQTVTCSLYPTAPTGNTPNSLALTPDGKLLFVANADANNLAVFNIENRVQAKPLGFIPTGWYPTSVRYNPLDKRIYVVNGKGTISKANRGGPNPLQPAVRDLNEYIGQLLKGSLTILDMPTPADMAKYSKTAYECSPLQKDNAVRSEGVAADHPIPRKLGEASPIKHVIYCIKENRTYDQVFGDMKEGNGEADLCLFPEAITPNHHKLAREFVLLDNTYVDGEVSADGHEWSVGAYATDFIEKVWPIGYRGNSKGAFPYPSEGAMPQIAPGSGGYLWDKAIEANVSVRNYGEWCKGGKKKADGTYADAEPAAESLKGRIDPQYHPYDLDYPDVQRAERFISELKRFEQIGEMPRLQIMRLPNDHTSGTRVGKPTPTAMVADNDLALGLVVDAVSKSKFWKDTAIFVIEDDAQNGPDHVDAHRVVSLVISPYTKRRFTDSTLYSTTSLLRTMELILGLKPMSAFDAAARPMYNAFTSKPDFTPFNHAIPKTDLKAVNEPGAVGSALSEKFDLTKEDQADDILFNRVIWQSVKGAKSEMPAPVRAAFFVPIGVKKEDDDDDE